MNLKSLSASASGAILAMGIATGAAAEVKDVVVYDHTKTMRVKTPTTQRVCENMNVPIYGTTTQQGNASGGALIGMLLGAAGGKAVTGDDKGAAIGAIMGGLVVADKVGYEILAPSTAALAATSAKASVCHWCDVFVACVLATPDIKGVSVGDIE